MQPRSSNAVITHQLSHRRVGLDASDPNYCGVDDEDPNKITCAMQDPSQPEGTILWVEGFDDEMTLKLFNSIMKALNFGPIRDTRENPERKLFLSCTDGAILYDPTTPPLNLAQQHRVEKNCGENHHTPVFFDYVTKGAPPVIVLIFILLYFLNGRRFGGPQPDERKPDERKPGAPQRDNPALDEPKSAGDDARVDPPSQPAADLFDEEQGAFVNQHADLQDYGSINATGRQRPAGATLFSSACQKLRDCFSFTTSGLSM